MHPQTPKPSRAASSFASRSLPDQPGQGRRVPEHEGGDELREVFVQSWRLIYRVTDDRILIVAVVHGARLLRNLPPMGQQPVRLPILANHPTLTP